MKVRIVIIAAISISCLAIAMVSLRDNIFSPYVPFKTAEQSAGKYVQVIGQVVKSSISYGSDGYSFKLKDKENNEITAFKTGIKPLNFEHADQVVLIGVYDNKDKRFIADKVLTKCPSRYVREK